MTKTVYEESVKTVANSFNSISTNLNYISKRRKYFIYNSNVLIWIRRSQEIFKKTGGNLLESEADFLRSFISTFSKSRIHDIFRVDPRNYLEVFNKGLKALESRCLDERKHIVKSSKNIDIESRIQLLFKLVYEIFKKTRERVVDDFSLFLNSPDKFVPLAMQLHKVSINLIKLYYFEFLYLENSKEVSIEELEQFQYDLLDDWYNEFVEGREEGSFILVDHS